jgi:hypothetical protein
VHSALRQRELAINRTRGGLQLGIMNLRNDQAPFSLAEFAAATIAIAIVAVIAFQGILGPREANLSAGKLSRPRLMSASGASSLKVSPWRLDSSPDANSGTRPYRPSDVVSVRKTGSSGPGSAGSSPPARHADGNAPRASTFFTEAAPATIVEMQLPDFGGSLPLIDPPDLFHMRNAIAAQSARPIKEATNPPRLEWTNNR